MPKRYRALVILAVASTARYGELVALRRRDLDLGVGELAWDTSFGADVVAFSITDQDGEGIQVIANLGDEPVPVPEGAQVLVSSGHLVGGAVPTDTTVWLRRT